MARRMGWIGVLFVFIVVLGTTLSLVLQLKFDRSFWLAIALSGCLCGGLIGGGTVWLWSKLS